MFKKRFCAAFPAFFLLTAPGSSIFGSKIDFEDKTLIQTVQTKLNAAGFDCGTPDGVAGTKTRQAVQDFRAEHGLAAGEQIDADLFNRSFEGRTLGME